MSLFDDAARIDLTLDSRSASYENPNGARGAGGTLCGGRKGPFDATNIAPDETKEILNIEGPGRVRRIWVSPLPMPPEMTRAVWLEVYYDDLEEPSVSVPFLDFFGLSHGRPVAYESAMTSAIEGRGFNAFFPMSFKDKIRIEVTNNCNRTIMFFYEIDFTLEPEFPADLGYLHVAFRRENPTVLKQDFVIAGGLKGPGRYLGCAAGIRVLKTDMHWYGEGEVKIYRDGDTDNPTICGTGLECYVASGWGMASFTSMYYGVPLLVRPEGTSDMEEPDFVGFYRWHLPDPIVFHDELTVTVQQMGSVGIMKGEEHLLEEYGKKYQTAGEGWALSENQPGMEQGPGYAFGMLERSDDYAAASFVYCQKPQPVPRLDVGKAMADMARLEYERPTDVEATMFGTATT